MFWESHLAWKLKAWYGCLWQQSNPGRLGVGRSRMEQKYFSYEMIATRAPTQAWQWVTVTIHPDPYCSLEGAPPGHAHAKASGRPFFSHQKPSEEVNDFPAVKDTGVSSMPNWSCLFSSSITLQVGRWIWWFVPLCLAQQVLITCLLLAWHYVMSVGCWWRVKSGLCCLGTNCVIRKKKAEHLTSNERKTCEGGDIIMC